MQVKKGRVWRFPLSEFSPDGPARPPGRGRGGVGLVSLDTIKRKRPDLHASTHRGSADYFMLVFSSSSVSKFYKKCKSGQNLTFLRPLRLSRPVVCTVFRALSFEDGPRP